MQSIRKKKEKIYEKIFDFWRTNLHIESIVGTIIEHNVWNGIAIWCTNLAYLVSRSRNPFQIVTFPNGATKIITHSPNEFPPPPFNGSYIIDRRTQAFNSLRRATEQ